jgi:ABC-2 type transport system permease protein
MELLITSSKPVNLMFGKVIGSGLAGLLQMVSILAASFVFYNFNKLYFQDNMIVKSIFDMPLEILFYTIIFFLLGYFIYSFMYGALGSLASRTEDLNTSIMPVTFVFIIAFFIVMFSMSSGNVDSSLMVVASYFPLTSPMAMFVRIAMGNVKPIEITLSIVLLIGTTIGIGYISAGIYRVGVLLYGKPPKIREVIKILKASKL